MKKVIIILSLIDGTNQYISRRVVSVFFCTGEQIRRQRINMARPLFR